MKLASSNTHRFDRQRGAALAVGLIMLLVMTVLAISMSQTSRIQERIAGNARDIAIAQQSVESALRAGEAEVLVSSGAAAQPYNYFFSANIDLPSQNAAWWAANAKEFETAGSKDIAEAATDPYYVLEHHGWECLSLITPCEPARDFYSVTAFATGTSSDTETVATSVYVLNR